MKNYYTQTLSFVLFLLCAAGVARAQHVWQNSLPQPAAAAAPVVRASDATEGKIYLGHCKYSDYIYPWDGLSQSVDCRVGVAVKLTRDMFKDYIGGEEREGRTRDVRPHLLRRREHRLGRRHGGLWLERAEPPRGLHHPRRG